jgi:hypothetical protein
MTAKYFNSTKDSIDIFNLLSYINSKDLFRIKLLSLLITNFNRSKNNISINLTFQQAHLNNKLIKRNFISIFKVILDTVNIPETKKQDLIDKAIIATDNASKTLSLVVEFNDLTTTITIVSSVLASEHQLSIHNRKQIVETFYLPYTSCIFNNDHNDIFTLSGKNELFRIIEENKNISFNEIFLLKSFYKPRFVYDYESQALLTYELLEHIKELTGFSVADLTDEDVKKNNIAVFKDENGFYINYY